MFAPRGTREEATTSPLAGTTLDDLEFRLMCDARGSDGPKLVRQPFAVGNGGGRGGRDGFGTSSSSGEGWGVDDGDDNVQGVGRHHGGSGGGGSRRSGWLVLDTPGVMVQDHVTHLLTPDEQRAVSPTSCTPKVHTLRRGQSLLFGGLARLDYTDGDEDHIIVTTFAAPTVRVSLRAAALLHFFIRFLRVSANMIALSYSYALMCKLQPFCFSRMH
jgi:hypothetical protein